MPQGRKGRITWLFRMNAWDVAQIVLFLAAYMGVKKFQMWLRERYVHTEQPQEEPPAAENTVGPPSFLARVWSKVVEWDAALVEHLARDPAPPAKKKGN
jgi:hypothetical protein